jgi:hypothetical protein
LTKRAGGAAVEKPLISFCAWGDGRGKELVVGGGYAIVQRPINALLSRFSEVPWR